MINSLLSYLALAQATAAEAAAPAAEGAAPAAGGSPWGSMLIFLPLLGIMYFLMIRPQQKKQKQIQEMLRQIKVGDRVMTTAGAIGTLVSVNDRTVRISFAKGVEIEYVRAAVGEIIPPEGAEAPAEKK